MKANIDSFNQSLKSKICSQRDNYPSVYLSSAGELSVYRCQGLIEYTHSMVKIKTEFGVVGIYGAELGLNTFSNSEITVFGRIIKIEFEEAGNERD